MVCEDHLLPRRPDSVRSDMHGDVSVYDKMDARSDESVDRENYSYSKDFVVELLLGWHTKHSLTISIPVLV